LSFLDSKGLVFLGEGKSKGAGFLLWFSEVDGRGERGGSTLGYYISAAGALRRSVCFLKGKAGNSDQYLCLGKIAAGNDS
jgi:hypothetical protein